MILIIHPTVLAKSCTKLCTGARLAASSTTECTRARLAASSITECTGACHVIRHIVYWCSLHHPQHSKPTFVNRNMMRVMTFKDKPEIVKCIRLELNGPVNSRQMCYRTPACLDMSC